MLKEEQLKDVNRNQDYLNEQENVNEEKIQQEISQENVVKTAGGKKKKKKQTQEVK